MLQHFVIRNNVVTVVGVFHNTVCNFWRISYVTISSSNNDNLYLTKWGTFLHQCWVRPGQLRPRDWGMWTVKAGFCGSHHTNDVCRRYYRLLDYGLLHSGLADAVSGNSCSWSCRHLHVLVSWIIR